MNPYREGYDVIISTKELSIITVKSLKIPNGKSQSINRISQHNSQTEKDKQRSTKHYTEN